MNDFIFGFDDNLGLPNDFIGKINLKIRSYHELGTMVKDFEQGQLSMIFLPVGTLPYVKGNYTIIAQASIGQERKNTIKTKLVTAKNLKLVDIARVFLGRVNPYCTTSFWAPLIYLMHQGVAKGSIRFIDTNGFEDMLAKTAKQKIDAAMVWDVILEKYPQYKVQELASIDNLPTPVIIAQQEIPAVLQEKVTRFCSDDKTSFFNGFTKPNLTLIHNFKDQMALAESYFNLGLNHV
jgi:hypothetical protein